MTECRLRRAVLLITKLHRLVRNAHFLLGFDKAGVEFVAADMPHANRLTVGIVALVAEEEAGPTSARTKAALAGARARGYSWGTHGCDPATRLPRRKRAAWSTQANKRAAAVRCAGTTTQQELADALIAHGVCTPRGERWRPWQVRCVLNRAHG